MWWTVISILAFVLCICSTIISFLKDDFLEFCIWSLLALLNILSFIGSLEEFGSVHSDDTPKPKTLECKEYKVDTTMVITKDDTTRTYVITYL